MCVCGREGRGVGGGEVQRSTVEDYYGLPGLPQLILQTIHQTGSVLSVPGLSAGQPNVPKNMSLLHQCSLLLCSCFKR